MSIKYLINWYIIYPIYKVRKNGIRKTIKRQFKEIIFGFYMMKNHVEKEESNYRSLHKKEESKDLLSLLFNI